MSTYDHKQVITDYANDRITSDMAVGHSLQHIGHLYEAQNTAKASQRELQTKVDALEKNVNHLQAQVDRLFTFIEPLRAKPK